MERDHLPDEEEQLAADKKVLENSKGRPLTLRTLDIGGDKTLSYWKLPSESNPFLGDRALRLCFSNPDILKTQLRAALRASVYGNLWIMFPMVGSIEDIKLARKYFDNAKEELKRDGYAYDNEVKFGIMIEIPSIAMISDLAAELVDFASIGTNDLCQYMCAADRMNPAASDYYQPFSPGVLRILDYTIKAFHKAGKPISVCGELAGDTRGALLLAGMGVQKLSMSESKIAQIKACISLTIWIVQWWKRQYFQPTQQGAEAAVAEKLEYIKSWRNK